MRMIASILTGFCTAIVLLPLYTGAQDMSASPSSAPETFKKSFAGGVKVSTLGPGLDFAMSVSKKLNLRLSGSYLSLNMSTVKDYDEVNVEFKTTATIGAIGVLADWHPFESAPIIKFTGGLMYNFNTAKTSGYTTETYSFDEGKYTFTPEDIGELELSFKVNPVAPYIGAGFGNAIPKKKWGFLIELGTLYHGSPKVEFIAKDDNSLIAPTAEQGDIIEENVKNYYLYPVLSFQLNYKIK